MAADGDEDEVAVLWVPLFLLGMMHDGARDAVQFVKERVKFESGLEDRYFTYTSSSRYTVLYMNFGTVCKYALFEEVH